ncbi:hypothetical protein CAPTEDRAFT_195346 [Capitella teleta]|uniref:Uncharacterized protein n=1 Tax=Capitella teleta TaxID=283909 RepID=R7TDD8_CAPTE|nr:hypothetical protein CAPTEDRAFT_195346 [Capitella teleta]|eukprot:ELT91517.1 hypothetical protein CAPTEDRAFT_195346 [Capitella teleta]
MSSAEGPPEYMYAVYVTVPLLALVGVGLLVYICCAHKYRFNWFETSLLQESSSSGEQRSFNFYDEKSCFNTQFSPNFYAFGPRSSLVAGTLLPSHANTGCGLANPVTPTVTCVYQNKGGTPYQALPREDTPLSPSEKASDQSKAACSSGSTRTGVDLPTLTVASNVRYVSLRARSEDSMGSNPSSPTSEENSFASSLRRNSHNYLGRTHSQHSTGTPGAGPDTPSTPHGLQYGGGSFGALAATGTGNGTNRRGSSGAIFSGEAEQFWVPPTVLNKKRAQSLIPHVLDHGARNLHGIIHRSENGSIDINEMKKSNKVGEEEEKDEVDEKGGLNP